MRRLRHGVPHARGNARPRVTRYTLGMRRFAMAAALAMALSAPLRADVEILAVGDRLDVTAARAPVSAVLDGLARKTHMKVVYEGPAPQTLVTVELRDRTPAQAVLGVLEGLGLNYALVLDLSGTEVETLMIVGASGMTATASASSSGTVRAPRAGRKEPPPHANPEAPEVESEEPVEVEAAVTGGIPDHVVKEDNTKPALPSGPLNPATRFPGSSPFAPAPTPLPGPSPSPQPPTNR
jgi:hypothetical protein